MAPQPPIPDPEQLVLLTSVRTEFEGRAIAATLESEGLPVEVFAAAAQAVQWEGGINNTVRVMVRRVDLLRARDLLIEARRRSVDLDWNEVDVGEPEDGSLPPRPSRTRPGGFSPFLWKIRLIGWGLLTGVFILWATGVQFALPAAVIAAMLITSSLSDRGQRATKTPRPGRGEVRQFKR